MPSNDHGGADTNNTRGPIISTRTFRAAALFTLWISAGLSGCGGSGGDAPADLPLAVSSGERAAPSFSDTTAWPPAVEVDAHNGCDTERVVGSRTTYDVGVGKPYAELSDIPWTQMQAGDVVNVFYRPTPYAAKIGLRVQGTAEAPFQIHGVSDPVTCAKPVLTGQGARPSADQVTSQFGAPIETLGLINIWKGAADAWDTYKASWIIIDNLRITQVGANHQFQALDGSTQSYNAFSAAIYAVRVDHLHVRDCEIDHSAMAVFTNSRGQSSGDFSSDVRLIRNHFHDNGHVGSDTIHNVYVQARRALYEGNRIEQLRVGAGGSTLKDRSSATVVRFNRIVSNARAIDLVETEEEYVANVQTDPLYPHAWVYGNLIVNDFDNPNGASVNMVHFGADNNPAKARNGTLYFFGNTVVESGPQSKAWYAHVFQVRNPASGTPGRVEAWNNIFANLGTVEFRFMGDTGTLVFEGTNSAPPNWVEVYPGNAGTVNTSGGTLLLQANPGLASDFTLTTGSAARGAAQVHTPIYPSGVTADHLRLNAQFKSPFGVKPRATALNLGAFE